MTSQEVQEQLEKNRRSVSFDSYDITVRQLFDMVLEGTVDIAPEYQRHFVWDEKRQSQLIESLLLGIPVPSLFMATNEDGTWEVIDGLQRLMSIMNFVGQGQDELKKYPKYSQLTLVDLEKLDSINGRTFDELPKSIQVMFLTRPIRVTVLNDRSDFNVRYELFERLNTGGVTLHPQEIRNCIYIGEFNEFLKKCAKYAPFRKVVKMTKAAERNGSLEELTLKFFAYYERRDQFVHSVKEFLNDYMKAKTDNFNNRKKLQHIFELTFSTLAKLLPKGIVRGTRVNATPLILYEAISIGVADCLTKEPELAIDKKTLQSLLENEELKQLTSGATNSRKKLRDRIRFVSDRLEL